MKLTTISPASNSMQQLPIVVGTLLRPIGINVVVHKPELGDLESDTFQMEVLVKSHFGDYLLHPGATICQLRHIEPQDEADLEAYHKALNTVYVEPFEKDPGIWYSEVNNQVHAVGRSFSTGLGAGFGSTRELEGRISVAKYKLAERTDEQAKLFPDLEQK